MTIQIPAESESERALWMVLVDLATRSNDWTLVGARMVELHAAERGRRLTRFSPDGDVLADARKPRTVRRVGEILLGQRFELAEPSAFGLAHTFTNGLVEIDLLAPEHLGPRSKELRTVVQGARTIEVPGGRQALGRTIRVAIRIGKRRGELPRPDLLGAILLKARAVDVDDTPESQRSDLALLLSLVEDPAAMIRDLVGRERSWIRRRREMDSPSAPAWRALSDEERRRGLAALRQLAGWDH